MNKRVLSALLFVFVTIGAAQSATSQIKEAKVTGGIVKGKVNKGVSSFKGMPFAAPPVKDLRWKPPQPVEPWKGTKKADSFGPACMQTVNRFGRGGGSTKVSENCLYLNVWTAAENTDEKRPVIVWIHGGGYTGGMTSTPMYDGQIFAQKGIVFVSTTYRLGLFGFMAHPELSRESGKGSGNYGLQDMIAGLQWVRDNIVQFGGDPSCVTIMGQSAGGTSVSILAASPAAKGLFHRVISQSGGSFAPPQRTDEAFQNVPTLALAESRGIRVLEEMKVDGIGEARKVNAQKLLRFQSANSDIRFWPVADGDVLPEDQYELYLAGQFNDTPILVGSNSNEGQSFARGTVNVEQFITRITSGFSSLADLFLSIYPHSNDTEANQSNMDIGRDAIFGWPTWVWAQLQVMKGKNKAFVYYFDHYNPSRQRGAAHGAEVSYVFGNFIGGGFGLMGSFGNQGPSPAFIQLSNIMNSYWVNFARTGDPNGPDLPVWPAFSEKEETAMVFGPETVRAMPLPNLDKMKAMERLFAKRRAEAKNKADNYN